jgi:hypothetical protein
MTGEIGYEAAARAVLLDEGVDVAVIGCVPLTPALHTLPRGPLHGEDVRSRDAIPGRLGRLFSESDKAMVCVVDAGAAYDVMAALLVAQGLPTFRTADRAMKVFDRYCARRLAGGARTHERRVAHDAQSRRERRER